MTAIELKMSLLQEVMSLEDEKLIKKALNSVRRMKMAAFGKATPVEKSADDYVERCFMITFCMTGIIRTTVIGCMGFLILIHH